MSKTKKLITLGVIILSVIAAVKNPSNMEAKQLVTDYTVEKVNSIIKSEMSANEDDSAAQFGLMLGSMLVSKIVENAIDVSITNCIIFSTFNVTAINKSVASGIILFGNVIPLWSDMNRENFQERE